MTDHVRRPPELSDNAIRKYLCHRCQDDEGPCDCNEPCGSVNCLQFATMCGTYPSGRVFHVWEPLPALTIEQIRRWKVEHPQGKCMCGERTFSDADADHAS